MKLVRVSTIKSEFFKNVYLIISKIKIENNNILKTYLQNGIRIIPTFSS